MLLVLHGHLALTQTEKKAENPDYDHDYVIGEFFMPNLEEARKCLPQIIIMLITEMKNVSCQVFRD